MEWLSSILERALCGLSSRWAADPDPPAPPPKDAIGTVADDEEPFRIAPDDLRRHCYLRGAPGCGKTSLILRLIRQDVEAGHTVVVVDLRGDLVRGCLGTCRALGVDPARITLLDLREKSRVQPFDPLAGAGEPYVRALHLLDVVSSEAESWGVQLEETMRNAFLLLACAGEPVTELERVLTDSAFRSRCLGSADDEGVVAFWNRFEPLSRERQLSWALPVLNKVTPLLAVPVLRAVLGGRPSLDLGRELSTPGRIVLVSLAVDELHRSARMIGGLVVSAVAREMMARVDMPEKDRNPVRLYVDEFENMAGEPFEGLIAEGRRFGLTLVLSHQTLAQLPARLRSVVRNNVALQLFFQCGFEDAASVAAELPDQVRCSDLRSLAVGEAFAMRRDGSAVRVRFRRPEAAQHPAAIDAYRARVLARLTPTAPKRAGLPVADPVVHPDAAADADVEDWL